MNTAKWPALVCAVMLCASCAGMQSSGGLSGVIAPDAKLELVREGFSFTEGPLPMADGGLYFTDLRASRVHRIDPQGNITIAHEKTGQTNGLAYDQNGDLIGIEAEGLRVRRFGKDGWFLVQQRSQAPGAVGRPGSRPGPSGKGACPRRGGQNRGGAAAERVGHHHRGP